MFNIYSDGVRSFSGTLERLYEVRPVEPTDRVQLDSATPDRRTDEAESESGPGRFSVAPSAISAYRNTLNLTSREPILHAHQLMRSPVQTVRPDADVREAWIRLREHGIRQMPVQTPRLELVGLLSERDLLEHLIIDRDEIRYGEDKVVADVMSREVITAEPVTEVRRIARVLADRKMVAMPIVTPEGELVGLVSRGDLLRAMTGTPPLRLWT